MCQNELDLFSSFRTVPACDGNGVIWGSPDCLISQPALYITLFNRQKKTVAKKRNKKYVQYSQNKFNI